MMSLSQYEKDIWYELRRLTGLSARTLKLKDLCEWSTAKIQPQEGETLIYCPSMKVYAAVILPKNFDAEHLPKGLGDTRRGNPEGDAAP